MTYEPEPKQEDLTEATEEASIELQEADLNAWPEASSSLNSAPRLTSEAHGDCRVPPSICRRSQARGGRCRGLGGISGALSRRGIFALTHNCRFVRATLDLAGELAHECRPVPSFALPERYP